MLVPNTKGLEQAIASGVEEIAIFGAASEAFSAKNINCSIAESLERFRPVAEAALAQGIRVRGYVSCVLGCPYQGEVPVAEVARVSKALLDLGCYEISLGDTIGVGTAGKARALIEQVSDVVPLEKLAVHFHDTYGQALANIHACLEAGVAVVDASVAGLGGCPYAKGASGNVATEDVVYLLNGLGIESGVDLKALAATGAWISRTLSRPNGSKTGSALAAGRSSLLLVGRHRVEAASVKPGVASDAASLYADLRCYPLLPLRGLVHELRIERLAQVDLRAGEFRLQGLQHVEHALHAFLRDDAVLGIALL